MNNCRTITIGVAALGGVALWIVLALGARGWFSSLLIAALLAAAGALIVLALVCPGKVAAAEANADAPEGATGRPETLESQKAASAQATPAPADAATADAGGRRAESATPAASDKDRMNDTPVLDSETADEPEAAESGEAEAQRTAETEAAKAGEGDEVTTRDDSDEGDLGEEVARTQTLDRDAARAATVSPDMPDGVAADLRETPELLDAPRGEADDLKRLRGVGPKLEDQLNRLGVWHLDQIASWSEGEAAWIDDHLEGFKGRILRDDWIGQARELTDKA